MALLYRRENTGDHAPLYTTGSQKTLLVIGLGNIGKEYTGTRHNIGFACVDYFAKQQGFPEWVEKVDLKCHLTNMHIGETNVILIKPTTYMNESGQAAAAVQRFYKITCPQTLVIHDELDLSYGQLRARVGGSHAGNNGVKSLLKYCDANFARIRIGVANDKLQHMDSSDFVLAKFFGEERDLLPQIMSTTSQMINEFIANGQISHDTKNLLERAD